MRAAMHFRIYLLDNRGLITAGERFVALGYLEAADTAALLYEACSDVFGGYELWRGQHRLVKVTGAPPADCSEFDDLAQDHQDQVVALEERIKDDFPAAQGSTKLLRATERFLARRYQQVIMPAGDPDMEPAEAEDEPSEAEQLVELIAASCIRIARQEEIALALERDGHLQSAATAQAILATFRKTLTILRTRLEMLGGAEA